MKLSTPKLSVITVCRNDLEGLKKTYASVKKQTFESFEWLVIDGASTDGTREFLEKLDLEFLTWRSEPDSGVYEAMNKGLKLAKGERVLFLNAGDNFADPEALSRLLSVPSKADVVYGDVNLVWPDRKFLFRGLDNPTLEALSKTSLPHPASAISRRKLLSFGGYDEKYRIVSDWKFWIELARKGGTFEHRDVLVADFAKDGISTKQLDDCNFEREKVMSELFGGKKLSVVIPVHNVEPYIRECLDSVIKQKVDLEIICVDDASTDASAAICEEYAAKFPFITVLKNRENVFAGPCRNQGLELAKGKYVAFLDSDDRVEEGAYRKLVDVADKDELEVVRGAARVFDATSGEFLDDPYWRQDRFKDSVKGKIVDYKDVIEDLVGVSCVPFVGICRRDLLMRENVRYNSLRCSNDISFFIEMMLKASRVRFIPDSIVQYRVNNKHSLVGTRTKYYGDVLTCGREIIGRIAPYDAEIRRKVLNYVFGAYPHWLEIALKESDTERQAEIKRAYAEFFLSLDKSPWCGKAKNTYWAKTLSGILGEKCFEEPKAKILSVIIPVYNAAAYIEATLESLLRAIKPLGKENVELIIVDDGSFDDSLKVIGNFAAEHKSALPDMKVLTQVNSGQGAARNRASKLAVGKFLHFLDADDLLAKDIYLTALKLMAENRLELLMFSAEPFADLPGLESRVAAHNRYYAIDESAARKVMSGKELAAALFAKGSIQVSPPLRIYERTFYLKNRLFFPEGIFHEDYALGYIALLKASRAMALTEKFYLRRESVTSTTGDKANDEKRLKGLEANLKRLTEFAKTSRAFDGVLTIAISELVNVILKEKAKASAYSCPGEDLALKHLADFSLKLIKNAAESPTSAKMDTIPIDPELNEIARLLKAREKEVAELKASTAYRVGMFLTWPLRKIYRALATK